MTHYIVESREVGDKKWRPLNKYCRKLELLIEELDEGGSYEFRVSAANEVGVGGPLVSNEPLVVPASVGEDDDCVKMSCIANYLYKFLMYHITSHCSHKF